MLDCAALLASKASDMLTHTCSFWQQPVDMGQPQQHQVHGMLLHYTNP